MKLTFLGTAAATAMPLPFCRCATCAKARSLGGKDTRKRSSLVINEDLLIDLGPDCAAAGMEYHLDLSKIGFLLQTHAHSDHFDAGHFITRHPDYATKGLTPLVLVASQETMTAMNRRLQGEDGGADLFDSGFQRKLNLSLQLVSHGQQIQLGGYTIRALESLHDIGEQSLIYLITREGKSILYATDLLQISEDVYRLLEGRHIDLLILDHTYGEGCNAGGHPDAGQVKSILKSFRRRRLIDDRSQVLATHVSHEGNDTHEEMRGVAIQSGYDVAYDGLIVTI